MPYLRELKNFVGNVMIRTLRLVATLVFVGLANAAAAAGPNDPSGVWLTQAGDAKVAVSRCGATICGKVVWLRDPIDSATGKPQVDDKNPNPALATRPIIGLQLFSGMKSAGPNRWSGRIYNADDGKSYASNITLQGPALKVEGCVGPLCGSETWSKTTGR
jgi:uncharacterized protein (DUF2147 family)